MHTPHYLLYKVPQDILIALRPDTGCYIRPHSPFRSRPPPFRSQLSKCWLTKWGRKLEELFGGCGRGVRRASGRRVFSKHSCFLCLDIQARPPPLHPPQNPSYQQFFCHRYRYYSSWLLLGSREEGKKKKKEKKRGNSIVRFFVVVVFVVIILLWNCTH